MSVGDVVLVIDIGGGIIDFLLVEVIEEEGNFVFKCIVVGEYILFGGDNMDFVFVYCLKMKLV